MLRSLSLDEEWQTVGIVMSDFSLTRTEDFLHVRYVIVNIEQRFISKCFKLTE
jgi:hypothetical protein